MRCKRVVEVLSAETCVAHHQNSNTGCAPKCLRRRHFRHRTTSVKLWLEVQPWPCTVRPGTSEAGRETTEKGGVTSSTVHIADSRARLAFPVCKGEGASERRRTVNLQKKAPGCRHRHPFIGSSTRCTHALRCIRGNKRLWVERQPAPAVLSLLAFVASSSVTHKLMVRMRRATMTEVKCHQDRCTSHQSCMGGTRVEYTLEDSLRQHGDLSVWIRRIDEIWPSNTPCFLLQAGLAVSLTLFYFCCCCSNHSCVMDWFFHLLVNFFGLHFVRGKYMAISLIDSSSIFRLK